MPTQSNDFSQYYFHPQQNMQPHFQPQLPHRSDAGMPPPLPPPQSSHLQIDPSLVYPPSYYSFEQHTQLPPQQLSPHSHSMPQQLSIASQSPSSQGSEHVDTPSTENVAGPSRSTVKRPPSSLAAGNRKKARADDGDEEEDTALPADREEGKVKSTRGSRACTVCRRLKMKCVGAENGPPCKRCLSGNHECIFEESNRGKRSSTNLRKHEQLTKSLRKMERTLETVLRSIHNPALASITSGMVSRSPTPSPTTAQATLDASPIISSLSKSSGPMTSPRLHSLPDNSLNPLGLLAEASLANRRAQAHMESHDEGVSSETNANAPPKVGVANDTYFKPGPMTILPLRRLYIERQVQPEMLNFVTTEQVVKLFKIYFEHLNMNCSVLDPAFHTPSLVCSRSPFLLTTICAVSSKFFTETPELHTRLTNLAKKLAFSVPEKGYKSVEIVQAYLLLTLYGSGPVERYEQDKTWLLLGMAIRVATDLNLHRKTTTTDHDTPEGLARDKEVHNRERTWLVCYMLDRSYSLQMGKPFSIKEDSIIRNASSWWQKPTAAFGDAGLAAYVELQRIVSRSLDILYSGTTSASGIQAELDYYLVIHTIEAQIEGWATEWSSRGMQTEGPYYIYRGLIFRFYFHYAMLVVNSFGLQNALERSPVDMSHFFARCYSAARACALLVRDELGPKGFLRYASDSYFVQCSYAVLSLLKLVRPEFRAFLGDEQKIFGLVKDVAELLETVAVGPTHTPALYSSFLKALTSVRAEGPTRAGSPHSESASKITSTAQNDMFPEQSNPQTTEETMSLPQIDNGLLLFHGLNNGTGSLLDFQSNGEMGPAVDISTFPPTMAPNEDTNSMLSMDSILSNSFWDSVLVPGFSNTMEGLSGGFVYGAMGSGMISPRLMSSPTASGRNTPLVARSDLISQTYIDSAFKNPSEVQIKTGVSSL